MTVQPVAQCGTTQLFNGSCLWPHHITISSLTAPWPPVYPPSYYHKEIYDVSCGPYSMWVSLQFSVHTCVKWGHATAPLLSLWNFSPGAARRDWRGAACDPCFIICLVTGFGGVVSCDGHLAKPIPCRQKQTGRKQAGRAERSNCSIALTVQTWECHWTDLRASVFTVPEGARE